MINIQSCRLGSRTISTFTKALTRGGIFSFSDSSDKEPIKSAKEYMADYDKKILQIRQMENLQDRKRMYQQAAKQLQYNLSREQKQDQLSKVKKYIVSGFEAQQRSQEEKQKTYAAQGGNFLPNNLVVKKLQFGNRRVLLLGVEEENEDHSIYVKKMSEKMEAEIMLTALPPDMPYFIRTESAFTEEWKKFVQNSSYAKNHARFYLNSNPFLPEQACLNRAQIELVRNNLQSSRQFNEISYAILQYSRNTKRFHPNTLLTPLLVNCAQKVYFCDFPLLKQREIWAKSIPLTQLRELFQKYRQELHKDKETFYDPRVLFPQPVLKKKFANLSNQVKLASLKSEKPVVFVCPAEYADMFVQEWKKDAPLKHQNDFSQAGIESPSTLFIEFVEKLVILDIMLEPIIDKYFIKNESFPYTGQGTIGGRQNVGKIFIVWKHFHQIYTKSTVKEEESKLVGSFGELLQK